MVFSIEKVQVSKKKNNDGVFSIFLGKNFQKIGCRIQKNE